MHLKPKCLFERSFLSAGEPHGARPEARELIKAPRDHVIWGESQVSDRKFQMPPCNCAFFHLAVVIVFIVIIIIMSITHVSAFIFLALWFDYDPYFNQNAKNFIQK